MPVSKREQFKRMLGDSFRETSSHSRYAERTGIRYLPPMSAQLTKEVGKLRGPTPVLAMWLIMQDSRLRHREWDLFVSGKRREQVGIGITQFNTALRKLEADGWIKVKYQQAKSHRIQLTDKTKDLMKDVPNTVVVTSKKDKE